jgi:serine/threonine protein kinase
MTLNAGTKLGPYEIVSPLGAGGMGEVYRAKDTRLGREVAIKVLPQHLSSNPEVRARFEREAKTVSALNHPYICVLYDVGREGSTDYLVMELIEGETLAQRVAKGPLPVADVLKIGAQIADALDRAHRAGVVHRDLKPGNVMLTRSGAKLMDFGLARATGLAGARSGSDVAAITQSPTVAQPLTGRRLDCRNLPVHGTRTARRPRDRSTHGHLVIGLCALRNGNGQTRLRRRHAGESHLVDHARRAAADERNCAAVTAVARAIGEAVPRQRSHGPLADRGRRAPRIGVDRRELDSAHGARDHTTAAICAAVPWAGLPRRWLPCSPPRTCSAPDAPPGPSHRSCASAWKRRPVPSWPSRRRWSSRPTAP